LHPAQRPRPECGRCISAASDRSRQPLECRSPPAYQSASSSSPPHGGRRARRPTMVADVCEPAIALLVDDRLVGAPALQIVRADELHAAAFGATLRGWTGSKGDDPQGHDCEKQPPHLTPSFFVVRSTEALPPPLAEQSGELWRGTPERHKRGGRAAPNIHER